MYWVCMNVLRYAVYEFIRVVVYVYNTCSGCSLWDLLLIDIQVQRSLAQLLQVTSGGPAETLQRQTHILLSDEQSLHHTFGCVQQICEGNLGAIMKRKEDRKKVEEGERRCHIMLRNTPKKLCAKCLKCFYFLVITGTLTYPTFLLSRNRDSLILSLWNQLSLLQVRSLALLLHVS